MNQDTSPLPSDETEAQFVPYEPPRLTVLGTLAELTQGGDVSGEPDGWGDAGASGTI